MVTVEPVIQPATGVVPLTFSRTLLVQAPVQLTIDSELASVCADAPANVAVKPVLPAPATVTVPGKPAIPLMAAATLALLMVSPPRPSVTELLPPYWTWKDWVVP